MLPELIVNLACFRQDAPDMVDGNRDIGDAGSFRCSRVQVIVNDGFILMARIVQ